MRIFNLPRACALAGLLAWAAPVLANHGPGASGGGSNTLSGETMPQGKISLSFREDYSQFEHFSGSAAAGRAATGGDFDALDHGFVTNLGVDYGLTDDVNVGVSTGFFYGRDFVSASVDDSTLAFGRANPAGMTDCAFQNDDQCFVYLLTRSNLCP